MENVAPGTKLPATKKAESRTTDEKKDIRSQNIIAARAVADCVRTALGPRGMDKMITKTKNDVVITNDGATILKALQLQHPTARMLVELSKAQDVEAGDGTTTVVVVAGALLASAEYLITRGHHPQSITEGFLKAEEKAQEILRDMSEKVELKNRDELIKAASTALNSKVVAQSAEFLAPIAVDAVIQIVDNLETSRNCNLNDIHVSKKLGGTVEDTELCNGLILPQNKISRVASGPTYVKGAKIGLIQFCLSAPKTDMESTIVVRDYMQMDKVLREERQIIARHVKHIAKTGCNVLLIQKCILRDAVTDLALDYLAKAKIVVIRDIEREDIDFICKNLGCRPIPSLEQFTALQLGQCAEVFMQDMGGGSLGHVAKFTGLTTNSKTCSILCRASNQLMLDELERSVHDALCVVRSLVKDRSLLTGGGAPEMEIAQKLSVYARDLPGAQSSIVKQYAEAFEIIPYTLAENCGLTPIQIVTKLRLAHQNGEQNAGINIKKGCISDLRGEDVIQPLTVSSAMVKMATETVRMILKIDDIVMTR